jgi:hypothetical protein
MRNTEYLEIFQLMQIENNSLGNLVPGQETINAPGGAVFIRGIYRFMIQVLCSQDLIRGWRRKT